MRALIAVAMLASCLPAEAQRAGGGAQKQTPAQILAAANEKAKEIEQLKAALRSPDQSVRIATYGAMFDSGDPDIVNMALEEGVLSTDAAVKALTFRTALGQLSALPFEIIGNYRYAGGGESRYSAISAGIWIDQYNADTGQLSGGALNGLLKARLTISGSGLNGQIVPECSIQLPNTPGTWVFEGKVTCQITSDYFEATIRTRLR